MHIGLFDSGVGGLTVLKELVEKFPEAQFTYLGDTARLPYGNKAPETIQKFVHENCQFLKEQKVDWIVIACHSASSVALDLDQYSGIPVFNVIAPSCDQAIKQSTNKKIGVMATKATTASQVYPKQMQALDPKVQVASQACPLLVPLVEEGHINDELAHMVLKSYLDPLINKQVDTVLLGCTHYPILKESIQKICGPAVALINPATVLASELSEQNLSRQDHTPKKITIHLTDHAPHFIQHTKALLGETLAQSIQWFSPIG
ncbi:MAG: glutamate racemase [Bdellovibrionales bacterium]|nr:glutamate racemase [Bdellovibrionales bacterium]